MTLGQAHPDHTGRILESIESLRGSINRLADRVEALETAIEVVGRTAHRHDAEVSAGFNVNQWLLDRDKAKPDSMD